MERMNTADLIVLSSAETYGICNFQEWDLSL